MSLVDFTDSANPVEIAYFDRGPIHEEHMILAAMQDQYSGRQKVAAWEALDKQKQGVSAGEAVVLPFFVFL